jgi:hypothetical protein
MNMSAVVVLLASLAIAVIAGGAYQFLGIPYAQDVSGEATKLVAALFVVTVFVERSTAVLASIWFGETVRKAEALEFLAREELDRKEGSDEAAKVVAETTVARVGVEAQQDRLKAYAALIIAFFVSAAGVRTLEKLQDLKNMSPAPTATQLGLYHSVDIVITAGLIAGGSAGISAIADLLKKFINKTKQQIVASWPGLKHDGHRSP